ncbi:putative PRO1A C6 Zink-finger protein [Colletotrichum sublineola]|uniref:Putative PRO1A C6 Zink-finger protein n=1 Tax=Colletotrichum sublineola TaxID=1173701 RepID=A0A066XJB5_COLSU|nr:putative PRO1A C6 Zink-finger protein [Colletotrichum sublineola]
MSPLQRRRTGCWTCRLRRKKCSEGGPPCETCVTRQVHCHGYGPKPVWKDKGVRERQEAIRLGLVAPGTRQAATVISEPSPCSFDGFSNNPLDTLTVPFDIEADPSTDTLSSLSSGSEEDGNPVTPAPDIDQVASSHMDLTLPGYHWESFISTEAGLSSMFVEPTVLTEPANINLLPGHEHRLDHSSSERETDLIMNYISRTGAKASEGNRGRYAGSKGWLLQALLNSPGFYSTILSLSAYEEYLEPTISNDCRALAYRDYLYHRSRAAHLFSNSCVAAFRGEGLVCAVQLAWLEGVAPGALDTYDRLLSSQDIHGSFEDATGCEGWVLQAIVALSALSAWKGEQELRNELSIRTLVNRADVISTTIEDGTRRLAMADAPPSPMSPHSFTSSPTPTLTILYAHAALVYLNMVVSGSNSAVSETSQCIESAIEVWKRMPPTNQRQPPTWPLLITAVLARGKQRDFFRELLANSSFDARVGSPYGNVRSAIERCWLEDGEAPNGCDWKGILARYQIGVLIS